LNKLDPHSARRSWNPRSIALIVLAWLILHIGCLFAPGLLDDVDSMYLEVAREMLVRHDFVTPYIDGVRFFDKPPLMYWMAAGSMRVFGPYDWAGRLPLAFGTLALLLAVYFLGLRLFAPTSASPTQPPDRGALYAALALATGIGPYLYTRFFIPDILICLWLTLAVHAFLTALGRINRGVTSVGSDTVERVPHVRQASPSDVGLGTSEGASERVPHVSPLRHGFVTTQSPLLPCLAFAAITALNLLTKGFIGLVFPIAFVLLYLALTRQLRLLPKFHLLPSACVFLAIAAPWHILVARRNPAIAFPVGLGLPAHGGWAWFYLYNEHIARFLSKRIPHDYGQIPVWIFWLLAALWLFPWSAFLPPAIARLIAELRTQTWVPHLRRSSIAPKVGNRVSDPPPITSTPPDGVTPQTALTLLLWAGVVLIFFSFSARQEYYSLPALPALALMTGGFLANAANDRQLNVSALRWHLWILVPLCSLCAVVALFFAITAPAVDPHTDIASLLAQGGDYTVSLGHMFDLTSAAMGLFRAPLTFVGLSMIAIGPLTYVLRRRGFSFAANLTIAAAAACLLLCVHEGLIRFYPTLGSKSLANAILAEQDRRPQANDLIAIDGELTAGSTLLFYTRQPVQLVNGRVNGPWYGSFWPDAPAIFETDASLRGLWSSERRIFLLTYHPETRIPDLARFGPVSTLASSGGKSILVNR
jgi:4-amino-4-deoxy-L-arabinose transferase-like glycosyltransferase